MINYIMRLVGFHGKGEGPYDVTVWRVYRGFFESGNRP